MPVSDVEFNIARELFGTTPVTARWSDGGTRRQSIELTHREGSDWRRARIVQPTRRRTDTQAALLAQYFQPRRGRIWTPFATSLLRTSLNARYRRAINARGHFPSEQAALKCLYLVTRSLDPTGRGRARWVIRWKTALNAFDIAFEGRLTRGATN